MTPEEHKQFHLEVGLECGECTLGEALKMHFEALWEEESKERRAREITQNKRERHPLRFMNNIHCDYCDSLRYPYCHCFALLLPILLLLLLLLLGGFLCEILV